MSASANRRAALRSIAVIGGGPVALVAAAAFARALPQATVTLIETPVDPAALADRLPAATQRTMAVLATIGIDEDALVRAGATHRVGERFIWGAGRFVVAPGDGVPMMAGAQTHQLWLAQGATGRFDALVPAAMLAATERFAHPGDDPQALLSRIDYALRIDPVRARAMLVTCARAARVSIVSATSIDVERSGERIEALVLDEGTRIAADLFVDAGGPAMRLAGSDAAWIDWSDALPVDRLIVTQGPARPSPADDYVATPTGWQATWSLGDRTLHGIAHAADRTDDMIAAAIAAGGERIALRAGRLARPFAGNILALGDAAVGAGPLGWPGFPLACVHLSLALELMPARAAEPGLVAEYNRRATLSSDRVCDYLAAYYLAGAAPAGPFWDRVRDCTAPEGLTRMTTQFGQRGSLPPLEEEMVPRQEWRQALIGLGMRPVRADPVAASVPADAARGAIERLAAAVAALPGRIPPYPDYLAAMLRGGR